MAVVVTYARPASHDHAYWQDPLKLLEGRVDPPSFNLANDAMLAKHTHAAILTRLHQLAREASGLDADARSRIAAALRYGFPRFVAGYLFTEDRLLREGEYDLGALAAVVAEHRADLVAHAHAALAAGWPSDDGALVSEARIGQRGGRDGRGARERHPAAQASARLGARPAEPAGRCTKPAGNARSG
jgi:hypothetical protein